MGWKQAQKRDIPLVTAFGKFREERCVPFTSRLKNDEKRATILINAHSGQLFCESRITEALMITRNGLVLPVLNEESVAVNQDLQLAKLLQYHARNVYSIMGIQADVLHTRTLLNLQPKIRIEYLLMSLTKKNFRDMNSDSRNQLLEVRRAGLDDAEWLFQLQKEYEFEEVLLRKEDFNEKRSFALFRTRLLNNLIYIGIRCGSPVSQAGTNARGYNVDQIGGVYTCKNDRNRGFASIVMKKLLRDIFNTKSMVSLFVKRTNGPAISLYKKLGFRTQNSYCIEYFHF